MRGFWYKTKPHGLDDGRERLARKAPERFAQFGVGSLDDALGPQIGAVRAAQKRCLNSMRRTSLRLVRGPRYSSS